MKIFIREIINISFNNLYNLSKIIKTLSNKIFKNKKNLQIKIFYMKFYFKKLNENIIKIF